jgi:cytoskeletal protein CcmA (bactofilin family)
MKLKQTGKKLLIAVVLCQMSLFAVLSESPDEIQETPDTAATMELSDNHVEIKKRPVNETKTILSDTTHSINVKMQSDDGFAMFGSLSVGPDETRRGDLVVFGGAADVSGKLTGDLVVFGGTARVSGHVNGDVVAIGGVINLASTARVDGDVSAIGGVIHREEGAHIGGQSVSVGTGSLRFGRDMHKPDFRVFRSGVKLSLLLTWLVFSFIIVLVLTRPIEHTVDTAVNRPVESVFAGFVFHVTVLLTCLVLTVVVIGIPLAILGVILWLMISVFGTTSGFVLMGRVVMNKFGKGHANIIVSLLIGFAVLALIRQTPFFIGWSIWQLWGMAGIGATVLSRFGTNKPWFGNRRTVAAGSTNRQQVTTNAEIDSKGQDTPN